MTAGTEKEKIETMFDDIAYRYDFLNHFLSFGIDRTWRKKLIRLLNEQHPSSILDVATGTGDLAITAAKTKPQSIIGIDISKNMLAIAQQKIQKRNLESLIQLMPVDSESTPFHEESFDAITVAFGVRNFANLKQGLLEFYRILKRGGKAYILEFSLPKRFPARQFYKFYFGKILPVVGKLLSGNKDAYHYLPESVFRFPSGEDFTRLLSQAGFIDCTFHRLAFGIATIYIGSKE